MSERKEPISNNAETSPFNPSIVVITDCLTGLLICHQAYYTTKENQKEKMFDCKMDINLARCGIFPPRRAFKTVQESQKAFRAE